MKKNLNRKPAIHRDPMPENVDFKDLNIIEVSILVKILKGEKNLANIGRNLDLTLQGVRYYVNSMRKRKYLADLSVTPQGYEFLTKSLETLKGFLSNSSDLLYNLHDWEIICDGEVHEGDTVYLYMKDGYLHGSRNEKTEATGIVNGDSRNGQRALIHDIRGIIDVKFGKVAVLIIKNISYENPVKYIDEVKELLRKNIGKNIQVFLLGEGIYSIFDKFESYERFAPLQSGFDAATRGLDAIVICSEEAFNLNFEEFTLLKEKHSGIKTELHFL